VKGPSFLDARPIVVAVAGSNGAGKTAFFHAHLADAGLRFVNADDLARGLDVDPYEAARLADAVRRALVARGESFVFETVLSDPVGDKVAFLREVQGAGYTVVLCFIGVPDVQTCRARVAMRVSQGGHDVPDEKLAARFDRTLANLGRAIRDLPHVLVYDNGDLRRPYRRVARFERGERVEGDDDLPGWLRAVIRP
jgi:predicted ABC-type ATPase